MMCGGVLALYVWKYGVVVLCGGVLTLCVCTEVWCGSAVWWCTCSVCTEVWCVQVYNHTALPHHTYVHTYSASIPPNDIVMHFS